MLGDDQVYGQGTQPRPYRQRGIRHARRAGADAGIPLTVYKCPGSTGWDLTGRGFHLRSLDYLGRDGSTALTRRYFLRDSQIRRASSMYSQAGGRYR